MALREAVTAEALDLLEAALGEVALIAAPHHAFDHFDLEAVDRTDMAECRHGAAKAVGLLRRELRGDNRKPHRLFLKQRNAFGLSREPRRVRRRTVLG